MVSALDAAAHGRPPVPPSALLARLLPFSRLPVEAVARVGASTGLSATEVGEAVRRRSVEWELLPDALRRFLDAVDARPSPAELAAHLDALGPELPDHWDEIERAAKRAHIALIEANLWRAAATALERAGPDAPMLDLIQVANHGLQQAVDTFRPREGLPLGPHAARAIHAAIAREFGH